MWLSYLELNQGDNEASNAFVSPFVKWLGYLDLNQGMPASKAGALPLGDSPTETVLGTISLNNGAEGET